MQSETETILDDSEENEQGDVMQTGVFYVRVKDDLKKAFQDFFPHMSSAYIGMAKLFDPEKRYPVLAVEKVTVFTKDGDETESARFLVPSENENFIWIQCELFSYAGIADTGEDEA
ncbi:MAG TPA: hypothetical protein VKA06_06140 [Spirochaetia bacterium]|nr:hypothetical protein [Spirochaetia bacterium]